MLSIAIVILNWNGKNYLEKFLPSVVQNSNIPGVDIYVADNKSADHSIEFLNLNFPRIKIIQLDKNYGFAEGYNKALKGLKADYYILLNSDVEVTPNWITPIIDLLEKDKSIAACMPKIRQYHNRLYFEYAGAAGGFIDKFGYPFCRGRLFNILEQDNGQYDDTIEVTWATGACLFIRSNIYHDFGGFDSSFFAHMEEIDLCWRIKIAGYKIYYSSQSVVYHVGGGTLHKENPQKTYLNYRNNLFLLFKNLPSSRFFYILSIRMILDCISAFKHLFSFELKSVFAIFKAHMSFYKHLNKYISYRKVNRQKINKQKYPLCPRSIILQKFFLKHRVYSEIIK